MAFSLASAPPRVKKNVLMSPGTISERSLPTRARTAVAVPGYTNVN